jgi:hypothetical protein
VITLMRTFSDNYTVASSCLYVPRVVQGLYREILQTTNLRSSKLELLHWLRYRYVKKKIGGDSSRWSRNSGNSADC